ncbi:HlyD family type I secretion periplasmic adaptor subunit [Teichococcus deserti]|uniref:HlyD family type I secretion periplasmic adaptor subunit n=1 Tax=Teichococcus deserti TaxID=1817963 RepID=UPI0009FA246D|nr:HlyD family type I secretion periplasmic adaptor subunit [Pseudoroseomonas deserti]
MSSTLRPNSPTSALARSLTGEDRVTGASLFETEGISRLAMVSVLGIGGLLVAALGWSAVMPVAEISVSSGEILPVGSVKQVQHLEGGIVARVLVEEGALVEEGQALVEMDPGQAEPELNQLRTRLTGLQLQAQQITAVMGGQESISISPAEEEYRELVRAQAELLQARSRAHAVQRQVINQQINGRRAELEVNAGQVESILNQIGFLREQVVGRRELVSKGLAPRFQLLESQRELARLDGNHVSLVREATRTREALGESEARLTELETRFRADLATELSKVTAEMQELRQAIQRAEARVQRLRVAAPARGTVQNIQVKTSGGVISPGALLMELVPADAKLRVEARITARDIGHIRVGQEARVKVLTFDYTRFGVIPAVVTNVSASSFHDRDGTPYYKAELALSREHVGLQADSRILSGMSVLADIRTGENSLLRYLLAPLQRSLGEAFRER